MSIVMPGLTFRRVRRSSNAAFSWRAVERSLTALTGQSGTLDQGTTTPGEVGTVRDRNGILARLVPGRPRWSMFPGAGDEPLDFGLLVETAATNYIRNSYAATVLTGWVSEGLSITRVTTLGNGKIPALGTAVRAIATASGQRIRVYTDGTPTRQAASVGASYAASFDVWLAEAATWTAKLEWYNGGGSNFASTTVTRALAAGRHRLSIVGIAPATTVTMVPVLESTAAGYLWVEHAQHEQNRPTSPVPAATTGAQIARVGGELLTFAFTPAVVPILGLYARLIPSALPSQLAAFGGTTGIGSVGSNEGATGGTLELGLGAGGTVHVARRVGGQSITGTVAIPASAVYPLDALGVVFADGKVQALVRDAAGTVTTGTASAALAQHVAAIGGTWGGSQLLLGSHANRNGGVLLQTLRVLHGATSLTDVDRVA